MKRAIVLCCAASFPIFSGGCALGGEKGDPRSSSAVVSPSVVVEGTDFSCPGVPDKSVEAMFGNPTEYQPNTIVEKGVLSKVACYIDVDNVSEGYSGRGLKINSSHYREGIDPWWGGYQGGYAGTFSVPGDSGFGQLQLADEGGGTALYHCGDRYHYVLVSVMPRSGMKGDLKGNLVNLASSMVPWACQGQPVPGLGVPMDAAPPNPTGAPTPPTDFQPSGSTSSEMTMPAPSGEQSP